MARESRQELLAAIGDAFRINQNEADVFDDVASEILNINRTDMRAVDIVNRRGRVTAGELAKEAGLTVLLTTHYLEEADKLASRLAIVDRGKVVAEGSPDDLKRELKGDAIHVELERTIGDGLGPLLERAEGVNEVRVNGRGLHARAEDGARTVPVVLQALEAHGVAVASVTIARPSLDDVYLRYAARTFSAAEAETNHDESEEAAR